ncbi:MAG: hypothetical protein ABF586_07090 [Sporolactobacillus sp.]
MTHWVKNIPFVKTTIVLFVIFNIICFMITPTVDHDYWNNIGASFILSLVVWAILATIRHFILLFKP